MRPIESDLRGRASRLGFGCASLGSRIGAEQGLRAMAQAFDAGVNWYDFAPSYGDGDAEVIGARFLRSVDRDDVIVCTKYGIAPPPDQKLLRLVKPVARSVVRRIPALRPAIGRVRPAARPAVIQADQIGAGLEASLRRLGIGHVDVFALHDPDPSCFNDPGIAEELGRLAGAGKFRALGIAGSQDAARAALSARFPISVVQLPAVVNGDYGSAAPAIPDRCYRVSHSVYGHPSLIDPIAVRLDAQGEIRDRFTDAGYSGTGRHMAAAYLLDRALAGNPSGTVLVSMFDADHLAFNLARSRLDGDTDAADRQLRFRALEALGEGLFRDPVSAAPSA